MQQPLVFISYSRADLPEVRSLARELRRLSLRTWVDLENLQPGERWKEAIESSLRAASAFVLCLSNRSLESVWTSHELDTALRLGIEVLPVMIEAVPIDALPPSIQSRHILDLSCFSYRDAPRAAAAQIAKVIAPNLDIAPSREAEATAPASLVILHGVAKPETFAWFDHAKRAAIVHVAPTPLDAPSLRDILEAAVTASEAHYYVGPTVNRLEAALLIGALAETLGSRRLVVLEIGGHASSLRDVTHLSGAAFRLVSDDRLGADARREVVAP